MKLVFLDRKTIGDDIDLSMFQYFGEVDIISDGSNGKQVNITIDGYCVEYCPHINPEEMELTE